MAMKRTAAKPAIKAALLKEAGGKCANPGCAATRLQIHHIKEWHVYQTHDAEHMIGICPTCHDAVHHNKQLQITDETLYQWKGIRRSQQNERAHIYVEPSLTEVKLRACCSTTR